MKGDRSSHEERLQRTDRDIDAIKARFDTALRYSESDPETALMHARKAAEAICRQLFMREISPTVGNLMLDDHIQKLQSADVLPRSMVIQFRTIQSSGNY